jgi:iron complex outermembrane receptor protein
MLHGESTPMKKIRRYFLQLFTISLGTLLAVGSGNAQTTDGKLDEITVTAEFRERSIQDTPIAITAVTGDMLDNRAQTSLYEVANQAPNVTLKEGGQARSGMMAYIRGVGQSDFIAALEPGVGVYVDDVYFAQLTGSMLELLDVDRVEILRGPQGTLSGRNSVGGAIKLFTNQPGEDAGGYARVGFGSYNQVDFRGAGGMTLVDDKLYARFSAAGKNRDGYVDILDYGCTHPGSGVPSSPGGNGCKLGEQGDKQYVTGRVQLRWVVNDDVEVSFAGDYLNNQSGQAPGVATFADRTAIEARVDGGGNLSEPTVVLDDGLGNLTYYRDHIFVPYGPYRNSDDPINDPYVSYGTTADYGDQYMLQGDPAVTQVVTWKPSSHPLRNYITQWGTSMRIDWQISDTMSFDSITAYREYDSWFTWDEDGSPVAVNQLDNRLDNHQFTQEFRLNGVAGGNVDYTIGAFYLDQDSNYEARVTLNYALIDFIHGPDPTPADTTAVFAHVSWNLSDKFNLSGGMRYSEEYKSYTHHRKNPDGSPIIPGPPGSSTNWRLAGIEGLTAEFEDERTDWRLAASYNVGDDSMVYGSASTGYKGGGVNPRPFFPDQLKTFDAEELTSYELGFKTTAFDNTLRFNAAVFMTDYENIQLIQTSCENPFAPGGIGPPCLKPANVGDADIEGFEFEATWYASENFLVDASASVLDFEYTFVDPTALTGSTIDPLDMITPYTPETKWALGLQYTFPTTTVGDFMMRLDTSYMDDVYADPTNKPVNLLENYTLMNLVLRWTAPDDAWQIEAQWLNLSDEVYYMDAYDVSSGQGTVIAQPGIPSTFNVSFQRYFN